MPQGLDQELVLVAEALEELQREAGAQFEPDLVRLFLPLVEHEPQEIRTPGLRAIEALRTAV